MVAPPGGPTACTSDTDCVDTDACNGVETCVDGRCVAGSAMDCDDGIDCTIDRCDDSLGRCVHAAPDEDGDGHRDGACLDAEGEPLGDDCDDGDADRYPGNLELCDAIGHDEDCDPNTLGGVREDKDGDGFVDATCCNRQVDGTLRCGDDCEDGRGGINPGTPESCNDVDDDCDGVVDEGKVVTWFADADGDGFGLASMSVDHGCGTRPEGFVLDDTDCDDSDNQVNPGATEVCDGRDTDCDGALDGPGEDEDGDGAPSAQCCADGIACECDVDFECDCNDSDALVPAGPTNIVVDEVDTAGDLARLLEAVCVRDAVRVMNTQSLPIQQAPSKLEYVGSLYVLRNAGLTDLSLFGRLSGVGKRLDISENPDLASLAGLEQLTQMGSELYVVSNPALRSLAGLDGLQSVGQSTVQTVWITGNATLTSLAGLEALTSVGALFITSNALLASLHGLDSLTTVSTLRVLYNPALTSLQGAEGLTQVDEDVSITDNPMLTSLRGLDGLKRVQEASVHRNEALVSLEGLQALETADVVSIRSNPMLTSLRGLDGLKRALEVEVIQNEALVSVEGLQTLETVDSIRVEENLGLQQCLVDDWLASGVSYGQASTTGNSAATSLCSP